MTTFFTSAARIAPGKDVCDHFWVDLACSPIFSEMRRKNSCSTLATTATTAASSTPSGAPSSKTSPPSKFAPTARTYSERAPVDELLTPGILNEVLEKAHSRKPLSAGPAVVIEMQWGSSRFLPAHKSGQKYKKVATDLKETLEKKGVAVSEFQGNQRGRGIFDRYSKKDRVIPGNLASNISYSAAGPSRLGAFEVHCFQGTWDPQRCCPGEGKHEGSAVHVAGHGVLCAACATRVSGVAAKCDPMSQQHSLMHSKLWTRRWPCKNKLLLDIGSAVIPPPPPRGIDFQFLQPAASQFQALSVIPLPAPGQLPAKRAYPESQEALIKRRLYDLDCPAKKGWKVTKSGENICNCGGGSHWLSLEGEIGSMMTELGFDKAHFMSFVSENRVGWAGKDINAFMQHYLQLDNAAMKAKMEELNKKHQQACTNIDSSYQRIKDNLDVLLKQHTAFMGEMEQTVAQWKKDYDAGHERAQRAYVAYCVQTIGLVSDQPPQISLSSSVEAAEQALKQAHAVNQQRWRAFQEWAAVVACWSDVPGVFSHRPDLRAADPKAAERAAAEVRASAERARSEMSQAYPSRRPAEDALKAIQTKWQDAVREHEQLVKREGSS